MRELLEESLERIHANASGAATFLEQQGLRGSEEAAAEQLLCARADILVMCTRREGCACGQTWAECPICRTPLVSNSQPVIRIYG